ncbi:MAG: RHS repeat-associated core domain-containing protein [Desulfitobacteriaceae bacterium]
MKKILIVLFLVLMSNLLLVPCPSIATTGTNYTLTSGQSITYTNNNTINITITITMFTGNQLDYALYLENNSQVGYGQVKTNSSLNIPSGDRIVLTNKGTADLSFFESTGFFNPTATTNTALTYTTLNPGESTTFTNSSVGSFGFTATSNTTTGAKFDYSYYRTSGASETYLYGHGTANSSQGIPTGDRAVLTNTGTTVLSFFGPSEVFYPTATTNTALTYTTLNLGESTTFTNSSVGSFGFTATSNTTTGAKFDYSYYRSSGASDTYGQGTANSSLTIPTGYWVVLTNTGTTVLSFYGPSEVFYPWSLSNSGISGTAASQNASQSDPDSTPAARMEGEPVDTATGAHVLERNLLTLNGAESFSFNIRYNSLLLKVGSLGRSWEHSYQACLIPQQNGNVIVQWSANRSNTFSYNGTQFVPMDQAIIYDKLLKNSDGTYTLTSKDRTSYGFDNTGKLLTFKNAHGQLLSMSYDATGKLVQIMEPVSGQTLTLAYNGQGLIGTVSDKANRQVNLTYDPNNNLSSITDAKGTITYTYNLSGFVLTGTDPAGMLVFSDIYDSSGRVIAQKDSNNHITSFAYDEVSQPGKLVTSVSDRNGNTKSLTFNAKYELLSVKDELGNMKQYTYDSNGNRINATDENGNTTTYTYDDRGNLLTLTDPLGHTTQYTYNANDILLTTENALGETVSNTYDNNGNLLTCTDPLNNTTTYIYNENGQVLTKVVPGYGTTKFAYQNGMLHVSTDPLNQTTTFDYDAVGRVIAKTDRNGKQTTYEYDAAGNILTVTDPLRHITSYTYDANGNKLTETDALGNETIYAYDTNGKLISVTDPLGHEISYIYDNEERLVKKISYDGTTEITTVTTYDQAGRVVSVQDPEGHTTSYTYDEKGNVLTKTEPGKGTTTYTYDKNGKVLTEKDVANQTTTYAYNNAGRLSRKTNALGKITTYDYDTYGHLTKITDPLGHYVSSTYDILGNKLTETDANGNITNYNYNANGKLSSVTDALNHHTQYQYDAEDRLTQVTDALGHVTTMTYDAAGRLLTTTDALGHTVTTHYDSKGQITGSTDALGNNVVSTTYDATGKPLTITDALGNMTTNSYDDLGRLVSIIDALNRQTSLSYDQLNRVLSVVDPLQGQSSQTFTDGNLKTTVDANNNETEYDYDLIGRFIAETTEIGSTKTYCYNAINLITDQTNGRGQATNYQYDDAGRLTSFTDPTGTVSYIYDNNDNVLTVIDSTGTLTREYDQLNRVIKYTDSNGQIIHYTYDEVGNLIALTYPGSKTVQYGYNAVNQLISVTDWANRVTQYEYDANGCLTRTERPDGSVQTALYDAAGRLTQQKDVNNNGNIINQYDYTYDQAGNITTESSTSTDGQPPYNASNVAMTYDQSNRLAAYNGQAVQYDSDGNMTSGPLMGSIASFAYDARNRLISAGNMSYVYDAENNRIAEVINNDQTNYVINPQAKLSQLLIKTDAQGNSTYYIYGLGLIGQEEVDGTNKTYHFDSRGSTIAITDIQGVVTDRFAYAPFGELVQRTGTTDIPFLFNGRDGVMTDSNGLYYMRARYYNPEIKRFVNQDVLQGSINNGQSMNRYAYVNGNPVSQVDPFGLCAESNNSNSFAHLILGGISLIPGFNIPASLFDSLMYLLEGDNVNSAIALACIIPFAKEGVLGVKIAENVLKDSSEIWKLAKEAGNAIDNVIQVTKDGVALPKGRSIPSNLVENPYRSGSYGKISPETGKFEETIRIDPATPKGKKGPDYSHYHLDGEHEHLSPRPGDNDPWSW